MSSLRGFCRLEHLRRTLVDVLVLLVCSPGAGSQRASWVAPVRLAARPESGGGQTRACPRCQSAACPSAPGAAALSPNPQPPACPMEARALPEHAPGPRPPHAGPRAALVAALAAARLASRAAGPRRRGAAAAARPLPGLPALQLRGAGGGNGRLERAERHWLRGLWQRVRGSPGGRRRRRGEAARPPRASGARRALVPARRHRRHEWEARRAL